mmetsp:Transcript_41875/g.132387  ORF Transcript_41875/g.132387 Transcript_41875/m.132387 type:complete len:227 (-) Transcript_41875:963-1643(-)
MLHRDVAHVRAPAGHPHARHRARRRSDPAPRPLQPVVRLLRRDLRVRALVQPPGAGCRLRARVLRVRHPHHLHLAAPPLVCPLQGSPLRGGLRRSRVVARRVAPALGLLARALVLGAPEGAGARPRGHLRGAPRRAARRAHGRWRFDGVGQEAGCAPRSGQAGRISRMVRRESRSLLLADRLDVFDLRLHHRDHEPGHRAPVLAERSGHAQQRPRPSLPTGQAWQC